MSTNDIIAGSPLARRLDDYPVPDLSAGFADRVLAAAAARAAPLPDLRRPGGGEGRGWRLGRRLAIATFGFSAIASAAAATGMLDRIDIAVPSAERVWTSITGKQPVAAAPVLAAAQSADAAPKAPVVFDGQIDTPEELNEAFRRIEDVRQGRIKARRERQDERIEQAIERRRAAGLPVPSAEELARQRQRIDEVQAIRQQRADERIKARRDELERKVESGEVLTREDIVRPLRDDQRAMDRRERMVRLRQMTPQQRREALRNLPPQQRRALIEEYRNLGNAPDTDGAVAIPDNATPETAPVEESPPPQP
ncbi:MAG: hypothetical protein KJ872_09970 [Alphaproteobacteria bacterium]|nr:hypothetical protein [Alphaproteobacteria bacterium]